MVSAVFGGLGIVAGAAMFVLVLTGAVEATGAPPYGALSGLGVFGVAFAFVMHATFGMVAGLQQGAVGLLGLFLLIFGLVGAIRRRRPWYTPLAGPVLWVAAALVTSGAEHVLNWLGSASDWDAAASWSATTGTLIAAVGQLPLWGIWIWRWTNAKAVTSSALDDRYARTLASVASVVAQLVGTIMGLLLLGAEIGLIVLAWNRAGVVGVLLALFGGGIAYGLLMAVGSLTSTMIAGLASVSIGLPIASMAVVFSRESPTNPLPLPVE